MDPQQPQQPQHAACPACGRPYDLERVCADCSNRFTLTLNQQEFFRGRGLQQPRRCERCRYARKRQSA